MVYWRSGGYWPRLAQIFDKRSYVFQRHIYNFPPHGPTLLVRACMQNNYFWSSRFTALSEISLPTKQLHENMLTMLTLGEDDNKWSLRLLGAAWLIDGNCCFDTSLCCFVKCFYFARYEVLVSCQKWVTMFPRWYSVGGAKAFLRTSHHVGMVLNV